MCRCIGGWLCISVPVRVCVRARRPRYPGVRLELLQHVESVGTWNCRLFMHAVLRSASSIPCRLRYVVTGRLISSLSLSPYPPFPPPPPRPNYPLVFGSNSQWNKLMACPEAGPTRVLRIHEHPSPLRLPEPPCLAAGCLTFNSQNTLEFHRLNEHCYR